MFLGFPDPHPEPLVRDTDQGSFYHQASDPSLPTPRSVFYYHQCCGIHIRRIYMFLALPDLHPDPLVRDTDPDPSIIKQKQ
jgi:hypothetical protein